MPAGQAGLSTLRLRCVFATAIRSGPDHDLVFEDRTYPDRLGWREVTAAGDGATIVRSDVPSESPSDRLRSYPTGAAPSHVLTASVAFRPGGAALRTDIGTGAAAPATGGFLAGFAARPDLSAGLIALMIAAAVGVGAIHALGPGHGKSLIGAYLIGADGTLRQAAAVGAAVSMMHTRIGARSRAPGALRGAGVRTRTRLPVARARVGAGRTRPRRRPARLEDPFAVGGPPRARPSHPDRPLSRRGLVALAFAGGILPSPSALVVLLGSVAIGPGGPRPRPDRGVQRGPGGVARGCRRPRDPRPARGDRQASRRSLRLAPVMSAGCIALVGLALTGRGLLQIQRERENRTRTPPSTTIPTATAIVTTRSPVLPSAKDATAMRNRPRRIPAIPTTPRTIPIAGAIRSPFPIRRRPASSRRSTPRASPPTRRTAGRRRRRRSTGASPATSTRSSSRAAAPRARRRRSGARSRRR